MTGRRRGTEPNEKSEVAATSLFSPRVEPRSAQHASRKLAIQAGRTRPPLKGVSRSRPGWLREQKSEPGTIECGTTGTGFSFAGERSRDGGSV
jgi:hypothetical protein